MTTTTALFGAIGLFVSAGASRTRMSFDYNWKFHLGDPASASPPLQVASLDASFTPNSTDGQLCHHLAWSQLGRMGPKDCRGACSGATPGCLMWQYYSRQCYIHDGTQGGPPTCDGKGTGLNISVGESRSAVPPPIAERKGVTWKEPHFDDSDWADVNLPHDFVKLGAYSEAADGHHGYLPRDEAGWYRKTFTLPAEWTHGSTWLHFEGVFQAVDVFVNGQFVLRHTSGYLGFDVPLDTALMARNGAAENVLALRVDASFGSGHWYEGGGVQRRVWLQHTTGAAHFVDDGLFALTANSTVSGKAGDSARVVPTAEVLATSAATTAVASYTLHDPLTHAVVASGSTPPRDLATGTTTVLELKPGEALAVEAPKLWSVRTPQMYLMVCVLKVDGVAVDTKNVSIGLRNFNWRDDKTLGATLNEEPLHIRGFSHHSDFGAVGGAVPDRINLFRANALRGVGGNTWRTSHNPYRPAMYDILDTVGVLVWDENRDFNQMNVQDMEQLVRRDRNHPSVIIWSACNEIECWVSANANRTGRMMWEATKKWDTTRPFSANLNQVSPPKFNYTAKYLAAYLDVEGFSHGSIAKEGAAMIHSQNPHKAMVSSECCSCQTQRGEDGPVNRTAGITYPHDLSQAKCMQRCMNLSYPYGAGHPNPNTGVIAGTLGVWTLFDYGGEPGPWPLVSSSFGQFDIAGFPKSASYWYRALWLASVDISDAGRAPLPAQHVVRVSQTWSPPTEPSSPLWPADCNTAEWRAACDPHGTASLAACQACEKRAQHKHLPFAKNCSGSNPPHGVWRNLCDRHGIAPVPGQMELQVFSDLPVVELLIDGEKVGQAPCVAGGFASFKVKFKPFSNLTAVARDPKTGATATHTQIDTRTATQIVLSLDAPSAMTGTGTALLLDGHDAALVRATVVDHNGHVVPNADHEITFKVTKGPGVIAGVHNGDAKSHEAQDADHRRAYRGLARAVVKVTKDATSDSALLAALGDGVHSVRTSEKLDLILASGIVVTATAPGLAPGTVTINVSADEGQHSVLAAAATSVRARLSFD